MTINSTEKIAGMLRNPYRVLRKHWSPEKIQKYIGSFERSWFAYASSETIRESAASGGVITALLAFLLKEGEINGALVCRSVISRWKGPPSVLYRHESKKSCSLPRVQNISRWISTRMRCR